MYTLECTVLCQMSWHFVRMLIIIISRSSLKLDHVGSKTRLLGHQATQVSDLGPLWPSCFIYCSPRSQSWLKHSTKWVDEIKWVSKVKASLWPRPKVTHIQSYNLYFSETAGWFLTNFPWKLIGESWKFILISWFTWPRWQPCPYMVKTFNNLLL